MKRISILAGCLFLLLSASPVYGQGRKPLIDGKKYQLKLFPGESRISDSTSKRRTVSVSWHQASKKAGRSAIQKSVRITTAPPQRKWTKTGLTQTDTQKYITTDKIYTKGKRKYKIVITVDTYKRKQRISIKSRSYQANSPITSGDMLKELAPNVPRWITNEYTEDGLSLYILPEHSIYGGYNHTLAITDGGYYFTNRNVPTGELYGGIYTRRAFRKPDTVLYHEIGHYLDLIAYTNGSYSTFPSASSGFQSIYAREKNKLNVNPNYTAHARSSSGEFFAECFACYYTSKAYRARFKKQCPKACRYIEKVVNRTKTKALSD